MGKCHAAIWIVLFAILANIANGSVVSSANAVIDHATVCDAQSLIRNLSDSASEAPASLTVCHLQLALGTASGEEVPEPVLSQDVVHAVVQLQRTSFTALAQSEYFADYHAASLFQDLPVLPAPLLHAWTPPGRASGNRYLFLLSPHAPPLDV